jgi:tetratricopeptide (TPR) repeat protein
VDWTRIKLDLVEAARRLKQRKLLDASVAAALASVPVVGTFASKYWDAVDDSAEDYRGLGQVYLGAHRPDEARACFLAAIERDPRMARAHLGIAQIYQIQSNTMIHQSYFQAAEDALDKAEEYATEAAKLDLTDAGVHNQLGYTLGTLGQSYLSRKQPVKAAPVYDRACKHFRMAFALNHRDASAENGLGGIALALATMRRSDARAGPWS